MFRIFYKNFELYLQAIFCLVEEKINIKTKATSGGNSRNLKTRLKFYRVKIFYIFFLTRIITVLYFTKILKNTLC